MAEYIEYEMRMRGVENDLFREQLSRKKSDHDRQVALNTLRELVGASLNLALRDKSLCQDDLFLKRFLYARKHDVEESFQLLINYYSYRQRNPLLFKHLNPQDEEIMKALSDGLPGVLEERDRKGRLVMVMFAANWNPSSYSLQTVYRALLLTIEKALETQQNMICGFVIVVDWTEFTFKQSSNLNPKMLKLMIEGLQDCYPVRFKGIHFIGQPWYVETALAVIKPFLKGKTKERIFLHGNNLSTLHENVAKDILPAELGGEAPSYNPEKWIKTLAPNVTLPVEKCDPTESECKENNDKDKDLEEHVVKLDKGYKKSDISSVFNNNSFERSAKTLLLTEDEER